MFDWVEELARDVAPQGRLRLAEAGAGDDAIERFEDRISVPLSDGYRAFLRRWDGATVWDARLFGLGDLVRYVEAICGFERYWGDDLRLTGERFRNPGALDNMEFSVVYAMKPTHFLPFFEPPHTSDVYCFDTSAGPGEYPVCYYEHDVDSMERILRPRYPNFEAFLLHRLYRHVSDDPEAFAGGRRHSHWTAFFKEHMASLGAVFEDEREPRWRS